MYLFLYYNVKALLKKNIRNTLFSKKKPFKCFTLFYKKI